MTEADKPRILLVDDETGLSEALGDYLALRGGMAVRTAATGAEMRLAVDTFQPDIVVLDLHLGSENGADLATWLAARPDAPLPGILFLSGAAESFDRILCLELHGDDFLEKPVNPRELLASLRSLLRRLGHPSAAGARFLRIGSGLVDLATQSWVSADGAESRLTASEFALLKCFLDNPRRILTRDELLERAPASDEDAADRAIDRRIGRLRRKLEADGETVIEAVRGLGYRLALSALGDAGS